MKTISSVLFLILVAPAIYATDLNGFRKTRTTTDLLSPELFSKYRADEGGGAFGEHKFVISAGFGIPVNPLRAEVRKHEGEFGYSYSGFGPAHARFEFGLSDKIGLAFGVNTNNWEASWTHQDSANPSFRHTDHIERNVLSFIGRMNVHFGVTDRLDPYWGIGFGYRNVQYSRTSTDPKYDWGFKVTSPINIGFETTLGLRYYFVDWVGIYAELGLAMSIVQGGVVFKF